MVKSFSSFFLVRTGERQQVVYFLLLFFLVGAGMALGRGAAEALFFKRYGIEYLPVMYILSCLLLFVVSLLYAGFVDRLPAEKAYGIFFLLLASLLLAYRALIDQHSSELVYPAYYLLYEVSSELLLVHSAVYLNQNFIQSQNKRLMPVVLAGHQFGVIAGGLGLALLAPLLGVANILLVWALLLLMAWLLARQWHRRQGVSPYFRAASKGRSPLADTVTQISQGLQYMRGSPLLLAACFSLFFMVLSVYVLAYSVNVVYTGYFDSEESLSAFFGLLTAATGTLALLAQLLVSNRLIRARGLRQVNLLFPLSSIISHLGLLLAFSLPAALFASFNKDTLMPAFAKPVRNIFIACLPPRMQGRGQAIAVILVIPLGLAAAGLLLILAQQLNHIEAILLLGLLAALAYYFFSLKMNRAYAGEILSNLKKSLYVPETTGRHLQTTVDSRLLQDIEQGLMSPQADISMSYARLLCDTNLEWAQELLPQRLQDSDTATKDRLVRLSEQLDLPVLHAALHSQIGSGDRHLDATVLKVLFQARDHQVRNRIPAMLQDNNARIRATAIYGALHYPCPESIDSAILSWRELLHSDDSADYLPAIELLSDEFRDYYRQEALLIPARQHLQTMLRASQRSGQNRLTLIALQVLADWQDSHWPQLPGLLTPLLSDQDWRLRRAAVKCIHLLPADSRQRHRLTALDDAHPQVRQTAVHQLQTDISESRYIEQLQSLLQNCSGLSPRGKQTVIEELLDCGIDSHSMQSISLQLADNAAQLHRLGRQLHNCQLSTDKPMAVMQQLLSHALQERSAELIDLALLAQQGSNRDETIAVIRAGLKSRDHRQHAHACELLGMLNHVELLAILLPLLDADEGAEQPEGNSCLPEILQQLRHFADPWLNECADRMHAILNNDRHE